MRSALGAKTSRDATALGAALDAWLAVHFPGAHAGPLSVPGASGASSELFFLRLRGGAFGEAAEAVLRLAPSHPVYPWVDLAVQADCMRLAVNQTRVSVPRIIGVESTCDVLGSPFLLMERLVGRGAPDWPNYVLEGWLHDLPRAEQRALWLAGVESIAALHGCSPPVDSLAHARLPEVGDTPLDRMLAYWQRFLALVHEGGDYPLLAECVDWLVRERPALPVEEGLVWGDASLRNMLFEGARPVGLMDFEFAHLGLSIFDIGFYAIMDHIMAEGFAAGAPRLPGFPGVAETLDYYASLTGRPVPARDYLLRMALTYSALATTRVYQRLAMQGRVDPAMVSRNPPLMLLGRLADGSWNPR